MCVMHLINKYIESWINWSHQVKYLSSNQVFNSKSVKSSWNFLKKMLS